MPKHPYTFTRLHRQFGPGDAVPDSFDAGTVDAMLNRGIIAPIRKEKMTDSAPNKAIVSPTSSKRRNK